MSGLATKRGAEQRLIELREAFDESFARPARTGEADAEIVIGIRAGGGRFAVRIAELSGIHACGRIVRLPGATGELLGIAGVRGRLYAAYQLAGLLGYAGAERRLRWLLLAKDVEPIAFGVDEINGYVRVAAAELHPAPAPSPAEDRPGEHVMKMIQHGGVTRGVLSLPSLIQAVEQRAPAFRRSR